MLLFSKINDLCTKKGITMYRMCKDTGIKQNVISNWKNRDVKEPSLSCALTLANYFDVPVEFFKKEGDE